MDTQVEGWGFYSEGKSNATISNSELYVLWAQNSADSSIYDSAIATNLWGYDSSHWSLYNTTIAGLRSYQDSRFWLINSTSNAYTIGGQSKVTIGWYLRIHVIDSIGQDIPSANVTATYPNATVAESELADANGWTKLTLMEKMMNTNGTYSVGNYDINATYLSYSSDAAANMTGNQAITLILQGFVIPEFPSFLIVPLFICATLFAAIAYRKKREKLSRATFAF
jgi:hypothetical protein